MQNLDPIAQYAVIGAVALLATVIGLLLYNRREKRRRHAIDLASLMNKWEMDWFADTLERYAIGDYSGVAAKVRDIVSAVRSDEAIVAKLKSVAKKVAAYAVKNDKNLADELREILGTTTTAATTTTEGVSHDR